MKIRDLIGQDLTGFSVEGVPVRSVQKQVTGYSVYLGNGEIIPCKGHQDFIGLSRPAPPPSSDYRIRQYGEFGSTIN